MTAYQLSAAEFWLYFRVFALCLLILMFAGRWVQIAAVTKTHKILGLLVLFIMGCTLLVVAFDPVHSYIFSPFFCLSLAMWFGFDNWYFYRYPGLEEWLNEPDRPLGTFGLKTRLGRWLTERDIDDEPIEGPVRRPAFSWKSATITMCIMFVFALLFGFVRTMDKLAFSYDLSTRVQAKNEVKTKQAIDTAVKKTAEQFTGQIASLSVGQQNIVARVNAGNAALSKQATQNGEKADRASKQAEKAAKAAGIAAKRVTPMLFMQPAPILSIPPVNVSPDKVKAVPLPARPLPKRTKQGKYGFTQYSADTSIYAQNTPYTP